MEISNIPWLNKIYTKINYDIFPHGLIISGPKGIGKKILAKKISLDLLQDNEEIKNDLNLFNKGNHPDFFLLDKDKILINHITYRDEKWDEQKGKRNLNDFILKTSSISNNKVALILNAESMNIPSQNALLKTLEEPASKSFIIMTVNRPNFLQRTIYSRCQNITIPNIPKSEVDDWLIKRGISDVKSNDFPSYMTPYRILEDIESDKQNDYKIFVQNISSFISNHIDQNKALKNISDMEINTIEKFNYITELLKIILRSKLLSENLSGIYEIFCNSKFNNLKTSNLINEINEIKYDYFKVPQINETHIMNYLFSEIKNTIKI